LNSKFDYTVLLEPTSPQRDSADIDNAIKELVQSLHAKAIVGISKTEAQNPAFLVKLRENGTLNGLENLQVRAIRRQEVEDVYFLEGSIYISETETLLEKQTFYHKETIGYEFPKWKSLEIDDLDDFTMVEALMSKRVIEL